MQTNNHDQNENTPLIASSESFQEEHPTATSITITGHETTNLHSDQSHTPFVWGPFISILFMGLVQPLCFELIFPFVNQMIVENGIAHDPEQVGFYSGFIESIFQLMSFLTIIPCSFISDHFGRKPVVLVGTAGMALSISLFGASKTYGMMIATRCIGGSLGGTWSALKVMMAELYTEKAHRAFAFSTFQIAFRLGQIVGQPLGGLLSHPARNMRLFDTPFWREYPFLLPCLIASFIGMLSIVLAWFRLEETRSMYKVKDTKRLVDMEGDGSAENSESLISRDRKENERVPMALAFTPHVLSVLASIFVMTIVSETVFALYPLFAFTRIPSGGLGLSEAQIGAHMAFRSFFNIILMFFYTPIAKYFGPVRTYQMGMAFWPITVIFLPLLNVMAKTPNVGVGTWAFDVVLTIFFTCWSLGNLVWPSSQIVVVEAPSVPEALAVVNGAAQMVQTLTMALAPAIVTNLFAFSIERQILDGNLTYVILMTLGCIGVLHCLTLKQ